MTIGIGIFLRTLGPIAPVLSSLDHDLVDTTTGDVITVNGGGLFGVSAVDFRLTGSGGGWTAAAALGANSATSQVVTVPTLAAGIYDVRVTTAGGQATLVGALEAWNPTIAVAGESIEGVFDARKGVILSGSNVTTWTEQSRSADYTSQTGREPTLVPNSFLGRVPGVQFVNAGGVNTNQWVRGTRRALATGRSSWWVAKSSSADATTTDNANNCPLTLVGDSTASIANVHGASAGRLQSRGPSAFNSVATNFNDGAVRVAGITMSTAASNNLVFYSGITPEAAQTQTYPATCGWDSIGASRSSTGTSTTGGDGYDGIVGAVVLTLGVPSSGYIGKLNKWFRVGFGSP